MASEYWSGSCLSWQKQASDTIQYAGDRSGNSAVVWFTWECDSSLFIRRGLEPTLTVTQCIIASVWHRYFSTPELMPSGRLAMLATVLLLFVRASLWC